MRKVAVTIKGCIDIPTEFWEDPKEGEDFPLEVAAFRYNEQLTEKDAIVELARKLLAYPDDFEVTVSNPENCNETTTSPHNPNVISSESSSATSSYCKTTAKAWLDPCNPCVCTGAPCEQCMFGYQSRETNHKLMKNLIIATNNGEKPNGWKCAETYMYYHRNWKEEMEEKPLC